MILGDKMGEKQRHYKFGDYILREKKIGILFMN
jgi:hypothetical protein